MIVLEAPERGPVLYWGGDSAPIADLESLEGFAAAGIVTAHVTTADYDALVRGKP